MTKSCKKTMRKQRFAIGGVAKERHSQSNQMSGREPGASLKKTVYY